MSDEDELAQLGVDELRELLRQKESNLMLAAQFGKQLLEKSTVAEARVEALERECGELKERLEHISAQYVQASTVRLDEKSKEKKRFFFFFPHRCR